MPLVGSQSPLKVFMATEGATAGLTGIASATIHYHKPGGTATFIDTPSWTEISLANMPGWYTFVPPTGMVDAAGQVAFEVVATGAERFHGLVEYEAASSGGGASAEDVWTYATRGLTEPVELGPDELEGLSTLTAEDVWEYVTRTLTSAGAGGATAQEVWEYATRALTDKVGFELTAAYDAAKTASQFDPTLEAVVASNMRGTDNAMLAASYVAPTNLTAQQVWEYATRTLTAGSGITAQDVWEYATRALTDKAGFDSTAVADIAALAATIPDAESLELVRMILSNRMVDRGNAVDIYNDSNVLLGTWTWDESTKTRGKLT